MSSSSQISAPNFYPRSPRGERRIPGCNYIIPHLISIHAPREGSDRGTAIRASANTLFLSTLPARGATMDAVRAAIRTAISIHAPREGSDGQRLVLAVEQHLFLSTLPARGATRFAGPDRSGFLISIHAPREGSDRSASSACTRERHFYPRSPRGERQEVLHVFVVQC